MTDTAEHRIAMRDGTRVFLQEYRPANVDHRPVILCLSGITRNSKDFKRIGPALSAQGWRVLALDYRGRGRSDRARNPDTYMPETYLDDIRNLLAALNLHCVIPLGTSLGGFLAMGMAVAMPSALAGAILNDVGPEISRENVTRIVDYVGVDPAFPDWDAAVAGQKDMLPDLNLDEAGWRISTEGCFVEREDGRIHADWDPALAIPLRKAGDPPPLWPIFAALRPWPTLALRGDLSTILTADCFRRMAEVHQDLTQVTVRDRGHAPTLDESECRSAINDFLARLA